MRVTRFVTPFDARVCAGLRSVLLALALLPSARAQTLQLPEPPQQKQPAWVHDEPLVMAGNWESVYYGIRRGVLDLEMNKDTWRATYESAFTEDTARRLKEWGITFVMIPLYKGAGLETERPQMEQTRRFAEICRRLGLRVGVYIFSGTMFYESILAEEPGAEEWFERDADGKYEIYNWGDSRMYYRRYVNRDHPGVRAHLRKLVRFAVQEAKVDLIHLDNYHDGPGYGAWSTKRFREYLEQKYTPTQRKERFGFSAVAHIQPPLATGEGARWVFDPLIRDFIDYRAATQVDTYRDLSDYARSLNPEIVMECNPGGYNERPPVPARMPANDYDQLLPVGGAIWHEGQPSHVDEQGVLDSRFRSDMIGRQYGNMVFQFTYHRAGMAESLANTLQANCCLWFENGEFRAAQSRGRALDPVIPQYVRFYLAHRDLYRGAAPITDIGVLNTFEDNSYGLFEARRRAATFEQSLYQGKVPFTLVPARYPGNLARFRALVLADLHFLPEPLIQSLRAYAQAGGGLVISGHAKGFHDLFPAPLSGAAQRVDVGRGRIVYVPEVELPDPFGLPARNHDELLEAVRWASGGALSVEVSAPQTTALAFYAQAGGRRLLHLVNYDGTKPLTDVAVTLQTPATKITVYSPDEIQPLTIATTGPTTSFRVPRLATYAVIALD